ncbi:MAG: hypothetical protein JO079_10615 [Frankiaceae bacterium]|nr:hypothetical protein [Frankiaceae bacterium]MBV9368716.1 hypothetical protein [Frankiales bacterium]
MSDFVHTICDECGAAIAWCELRADAHGVSGPCPVCAGRVTRPRSTTRVSRQRATTLVLPRARATPDRAPDVSPNCASA